MQLVVRLALVSACAMGAMAGIATRSISAHGTIAPKTGFASAGPWGKAPPPEAGATGGAPARAAFAQPVVLGRDGTGQFHLFGQINGRPASFLIDTGADLVALPAEQAEAMGVSVNDSDYRPMLQTASGSAMGALVRLDRLSVAGVELHDVPAVVVRGLAVPLLGQSALRRLGKVELSGDSMVISPA